MNGNATHPWARWTRRGIGIPASSALLAALLAVPAMGQAPGSPSPAPVSSPAPASTGAVPAATSPARSPSTDQRFPTMGGRAPEVLTFSGPEWLDRFGSDDVDDREFVEDTVALVASVGASIDDLTVRTALQEPTPGNRAAVMAISIEGARATDFAASAVRLMLGDVTTPEVLLRQVAGRWVLRVVDAAIPGVYPRTMYLEDDTTWLIDADEDIVGEVLGQLPDQPASRTETVPGEALVARLPVSLDGQRRDFLYELLEWFRLPSAEAVFEGQLEPALAQLYLEEGVTPADVTAAIALWGEDQADDAVQIEGYRIPGASAELTQRFLSDILIAGVQQASEGSEPRSEQLAGREAIALELSSELGPEVRYFLASGDIAWVVTDFTADQSQAEEAISSLP